jgi:molybdate transport system regulatory protein
VPLSSKTPPTRLVPRLRILKGRDIALGPGKADLLDAIERTGTISEAARQLGMSYMRAWTLIQTMNRCFKEPLVGAHRGGAGRGAAALTDAGRDALALYRRMEREAEQAVARSWTRLRRSLKR